MTDETVDCFNCGSSNPAWAQVCRSCGVVLRHGETRIGPAERIPTDRDSLVSIAAVILWSSVGLLKESVWMSLAGVPAGIDVDEVETELDRAVPPERLIEVELVWEPPWSAERMSERARRFMQW